MKFVLQLSLLVLFLLPIKALSLTVSGTDVVTINDLVTDVTALDSSTIIINPGAEISFLTACNDSTIIITGGAVSFFDLNDSSRLAMQDGNVSHLDLYDNSDATIKGGNISHLLSYINSKVTIFNAEEIVWLKVSDNSKIDIFYIHDLSWLIVSDTSETNICVNFATYETGILSGNWSNRKEFDFWAITEQHTEDGMVTVDIQNTLPNNINIYYRCTSTGEFLPRMELPPGVSFLLLK